ncbi:hypothetical protein Agub_g13102 [Astrephomene gubernaculifera]|uniref:Uncharacterized protein n=1 Tax=Astrephomene gubernaculifera TaxID=47775 RepID=A0AAD3E1B9_9CHLO|nr:hypothetical protein Agub_g13102 [Astrephomene gubernaculifera]
MYAALRSEPLNRRRRHTIFVGQHSSWLQTLLTLLKRMGNCIAPSSTPLFDAIAVGDANAAVGVLEAHPAMIKNRLGLKRRTVYHACAEEGQLAVLVSLCEHVWRTMPDEAGDVHNQPPSGQAHPAISHAINALDESGVTPLMVACKHGHVRIVEYMLTQGADAWVGDRLMGRIALHHAARANQAECIQAILSSPHVAQTGKVRTTECKLVDYPSDCGYTPLHYAAASRAPEAAAALLSHGADPSARTWDVGFDFVQLEPGSTPLHCAARYQCLDVAMLLIKYWADNLRNLDVTDPRVVENYSRRKPYQLAGVKANQSLYRVLNPATPYKYISDPFGESAKPIIVPASKAAPLQRIGPITDEDELQDASDASAGDNPAAAAEATSSTPAAATQVPFSLPSLPDWYTEAATKTSSPGTAVGLQVLSGWEPQGSTDSPLSGNNRRGSSPDFQTAYRSVELVDEVSQPPTTPGGRVSSSPPRSTKLKHQSSSKHLTSASSILPPIKLASWGSMGRGRSSTVCPMPPTPQPQQSRPQQTQAERVCGGVTASVTTFTTHGSSAPAKSPTAAAAAAMTGAGTRGTSPATDNTCSTSSVTAPGGDGDVPSSGGAGSGGGSGGGAGESGGSRSGSPSCKEVHAAKARTQDVNPGLAGVCPVDTNKATEWRMSASEASRKLAGRGSLDATKEEAAAEIIAVGGGGGGHQKLLPRNGTSPANVGSGVGDGSCTAATKPASTDGGFAAGGRDLAKTMSRRLTKKLSSITRRGAVVSSSYDNVAAAGTGAVVVVSSRMDCRVSSPTTTAAMSPLPKPPPPPVMSAWGDQRPLGSAESEGKGRDDPAKLHAAEAMDLARDSHAGDCQPVAVSMFPHTLSYLEPLTPAAAGGDGNSDDVDPATKSTTVANSSPAGPGRSFKRGLSRGWEHNNRSSNSTAVDAADASLRAANSSGMDVGPAAAMRPASFGAETIIAVSRRGLHPASHHLSEDENRRGEQGLAGYAASRGASDLRPTRVQSKRPERWA